MTQPGSPPNDSPSSGERGPASGGAGHSSSSASHDSTTEGSGDDSYRRIRDDFDGLDLEHQATFLVDATVSLLARGIETAARTLADEVDGFVERQRKKTAEKKGAADSSGASNRPDAPSDDVDTNAPADAPTTDSDDPTSEDAGDGNAGGSDTESSGDERDKGPEDVPPRGPMG
jgi:hypothetical protein